MALTKIQEQLVMYIDCCVNEILSNGYSEEAFVILYDVIEDLKEIIAISTEYEINGLCQQYRGFFRFMKFLEKLALGISNGISLFNPDVPVPILH